MINYFNFERRGSDYLITNDLGNYMIISFETFRELINDNLSDANEDKQELIEKGFYYEGEKESFIKNCIPLIQSMKNYCATGTALHIFAVTNACNLNCSYCQAHCNSSKLNGFMDIETGIKAVDFALQSPNKNLTFEFQGGEPLLNFDVVKAMIEHAILVNTEKNIEYTVVSNMTALTDEMLQYFVSNNVKLCTSLDGPKDVHNVNRPYASGEGSFDDVVKKITDIKSKGIHLGAIQTTSKYSLSYPNEIINQYATLGFNSIFLRPLTPLGMADNEWQNVGYTLEEFLEFYRKAFKHIMEINLKGQFFSESHATYFLKKIFHSYSDNYMELRSPCGAGVGQMSYYYNGDVFTCDEGRMLYEMGDDSFLLGNVLDSSFNEAVTSPVCMAVCKASIVEALPKCSGCVYQPYCGVCPVVNYASTRSLYDKNIKDFRCGVYRGIMDIIFEIIEENDSNKLSVLKSWVI